MPALASRQSPVVREAQGLRIAVETGAWSARPRSLPEPVLPLLVVLTNTGGRGVSIAREDFALLDQAHRQSSPIPPAEVVAILGGARTRIDVSPSGGAGGSTAGGTVLEAGAGAPFALPDEEVRSLIALSLPEGPIQPGAEARGCLYFPRPPSDAAELRLVAFPRDLPAGSRLECPLRLRE